MKRSGFLHFRLIGNSCSVSTGMVLGPNLLRKEEWFKVLVKMQIPGHKPGFCRALHQRIDIFFWVPQVVLKNTEIWESQLSLPKNEGLEWMSISLSVFTHASVSLRLNIQNKSWLFTMIISWFPVLESFSLFHSFQWRGLKIVGYDKGFSYLLSCQWTFL